MEYKNFDLSIEADSGNAYQVRVRSEMGETNGVLTLSSDCLKLADELKDVEELQDGSPLPMNLGISLHECLFRDGVGDILRMCLGDVLMNDEKGMRIRLMLSPPEIAALPWEVLYDKRTKTFLSTSGKTSLTRYVNLLEPIRALKIVPPVKVLALIPRGSGLDVEKEESILREALKDLGSLQIKVLKNKVTRSAISRALVEDEYHIVHFVGHGTFENDQGYLLINSEDGGRDLISGDAFADFFRTYPSLKLIVLNSCQGAEVSSTKELAGMAPELVIRGVPAVVAMQYPISDDAALEFAKEFYLKLCAGWSRGQVDAAISHARNRIHMDIKEPMAFATPVLFMRSPTGVIFDLQETSEHKPGFLRRWLVSLASNPVTNVNRLKEIKRTYESNIEAWQEKTKDAASPESQAEANQAIAEERQEISAVDDRIIRWNRTFLASLAATLAIFLMGYTGLFNIFHADDWLEAKFIPYMDEYVTKSFNHDVRLIMADEGVNGDMGEPGPSWRTHHADLIEALAGKAKVIVLDLEMSVPTDQDGRLADAIKHAEDRETRVILSKVIDENGVTIRDLADKLKSAADSRWGNIQVGGKHWGFVRLYQLAQSSRGKTEAAEVSAPSLALQVVNQFLAPNSKARIVADKERIDIPLASDTKSIPVYRSKASVYDLPYDLVDYDQVKDATRSYRDVYHALKDPAFLREFEGKIVFIGFKTPYDTFRVAQGEQRYGTEIHANVVSNILSGVYVRWLPSSYDLLIVALMAGLGALVKARFSHTFTTRIAIPFTDPKKRFDVPGLLVVVDVVYLLIAFVIYKYELTFILRTYHLVAPFIAYWLTGKMRKRAALKPLKGTQ